MGDIKMSNLMNISMTNRGPVVACMALGSKDMALIIAGMARSYNDNAHMVLGVGAVHAREYSKTYRYR